MRSREMLDSRYINNCGDTMYGPLLIATADGIDFNPGSDIDTDLVTVGVTGAPRIWWDESEDAFSLTTGLVVTNTIQSTGILNLYSSGAGGLEIQNNGAMRIVGTDPDVDIRPTVLTNIAYTFRNNAAALLAQMLIDGTWGTYYFDTEDSIRFRYPTNGTAYVYFTSQENVAIGGGISTAAKLVVDQQSTTAAKPVLILDQADISEEMIEFITTIGAGNAIEAVGGKTLTTTHFIKITLPGGLTRYIPAGTIA